MDTTQLTFEELRDLRNKRVLKETMDLKEKALEVLEVLKNKNIRRKTMDLKDLALEDLEDLKNIAEETLKEICRKGGYDKYKIEVKTQAKDGAQDYRIYVNYEKETD